MWLLLSPVGHARKAVSSKRYELLSGVRKSKDTKSYWDKKYSEEKYVFGKKPAKFSMNKHYKPGDVVSTLPRDNGLVIATDTEKAEIYFPKTGKTVQYNHNRLK